MTYTTSICNLCNTKHYIDNGNVRYELANTDSVSDLGVRFDSKSSFMDHINDKVKKAYGILGIIKRNFIHMDINSFVLLYKAMVRPHLDTQILSGAHVRKAT